MTIAAISTPQSAGGIGIIRISGNNAITIADSIFSPTGKKHLAELKGYRAAHGHIIEKSETIDECVATVFRSPRSYTGEDVVELSCHGGLYVLKRVLRAALSAGAVPAEPGEFTRRAFLNGKIDLTEAEAVMSIISAQGESGAKAAMSTLDGALSRRIDGVCSALTLISAQMSAWVDYPDDEIEDLETDALRDTLKNAKNDLNSLLSTFDIGKAVTSGLNTAIIGKPNVGKSELMNLLSGYNRSIVTDIPGTTRDVVNETVNLGCVLLRLSDTAGIHKTSDVVEGIGVEKAIRAIETADLILAVFDSSRSFDEFDEMITSLCKGKRAIAIINKVDLPSMLDESTINNKFENIVHLSAKTGGGLETLANECESLLGSAQLDSSQGILTTERQRKDVSDALDSITRALEALDGGLTHDAVNVCVDGAIDSLLSLTGGKATDAVVDEVFKNFCVGK